MLRIKDSFNNTVSIYGIMYKFKVSKVYNKNNAVIGYLSYREEGIPILAKEDIVISDSQYQLTINGFSKLYKDFDISSVSKELYSCMIHDKGMLVFLNPFEELVDDSSYKIGNIPMAFTIGGGSIVLSKPLSYMDSTEMIGFLPNSESYYLVNHNLPRANIVDILVVRQKLLQEISKSLCACFILSSSHLRVFLKLGVADILISHNNYIITLIPNSYLSCIHIQDVKDVSLNIRGMRGCVSQYLKNKNDVINYLKDIIEKHEVQMEFLNI